MQNEFVRREEAYHLYGALSRRRLDPYSANIQPNVGRMATHINSQRL